MRTYKANFGPDTFERIRLGLVNEIYLTYTGSQRPEPGDLLNLSSVVNYLALNEITMKIATLVDCSQMKNTVLIKVEPVENYIFTPPEPVVKSFTERVVEPEMEEPLSEKIKKHRALIDAAEQKYFDGQRKNEEEGRD